MVYVTNRILELSAIYVRVNTEHGNWLNGKAMNVLKILLEAIWFLNCL